VPHHGHQTEGVAGQESLEDCAIIDVEIRVAVEDGADVAEQRQRLPQSPAGPEQARAVMTVLNLDAESASVADVLLDLLAEMAEAEDDAANTVATKQRKEVIAEGPAGEGNHDLRHLKRDRP